MWRSSNFWKPTTKNENCIQEEIKSRPTSDMMTKTFGSKYFILPSTT